jgi:Raf kinase inhibitor-like YbhB/YbcL family protein
MYFRHSLEGRDGRIRVKLVVVSAALALAASATGPFRLTSPAFRSGAAIPKRFTCDGADVSPPLRWTAPPPRARTIALLVVDVTTPPPLFVHWLAWGMSPRSRGLATGARPPLEGRNGFGLVSWTGPCPPAGTAHRYAFLLYALRSPLRLRNGATVGEFARAVHRAGVLRQKRLVGTYRGHA